MLEIARRLSSDLDPGVVWAAALVAVTAYAIRSARRSQLNPRSMYWAVVCSLVGGLWGAHLLSLLVHGWSGEPLALFQFMDGGKSLFGGLLLGGLGAGLYLHYCKLPVLAYADAGVPALALGYAIGRIGCFLNGDDYGTLTRAPWAVVYPPGTEAYQAHLARGWISAGDAWSQPIHPVQLYACLLGLALFSVLVALPLKWQGRRLCTQLVIYGVGRFLLEYLRGDFRTVLGPFSLPQLFSTAFVVMGAVIWLRAVRKYRKQLTTRVYGQAAKVLSTAAP
jgi:phosphatidylglycerol:prolipoprotein diacylglycerol transferase